MKITGYAIRDDRGYITSYKYKTHRWPINHAAVWRSLASIDRYLQTDSFRRLAKHTDSDMVIQEVTELSSYPYKGVGDVVRTIPAAEVRAAAALASTRAERRARGLRN